MRKTKKTLAILAIVAMVFTMIPMQVFAATGVPARISGTTQYDTAVAIAEQGYAAGSDNVVLAPGMKANLSDALASGPLATKLNAPILLTEGNALTAATKAELTKLKAKTVYVTSGTSVIKPAVIDELTAMGITVKNVWGQTASETSVAIAKEMGVTFTQVALANGTVGAQDALSIASIASAQQFPILITDNSASLPPSIVAYLATLSITKSFVVGGTSVISNNQMAQLTGAVRSAGNDAYDTNAQVITDFAASVKFDNVFVANGETLVDALAGAPYAAKYKAVIVLTDGVNTKASVTVNPLLSGISVVTAFGGEAVVPAAAFAKVVYTAPDKLSVVSVTAINAKTVEVKFNKAVKTSTVIDDKSTTTDTKDDTLVGITFDTLDAAGISSLLASAKLSADGTTVTITAAGAEFFTKRYAVTVATTVKDADDVALASKYTTILNATDSVRPAVSASEYKDNGLTYKVTYSEPIKALGTVTLKDGTKDLAIAPAFTSGNNFFTMSLASGTVPAAKDITLTIMGATDFNDNVASPNPLALTVVKSATDTTKPTVESIVAKNDKLFEVTFSEKLNADPTITVNGVAVVGTITKDSDNALLYKVALTTSLVPTGNSAIATIAVTVYTDLSGNVGDATSRVLTFVKDVTAPVIASSSVTKISGVEYLIINYDENVIPQNVIDAVSGGVVTVDFIEKANATTITTNTASGGNFALYSAVDGKSKSVKLNLTTLSKGDYKVTLPAGLVLDSSGNASASKASFTFTRSSDTAVAKPALVTAYGSNGVSADSSTSITLKFDQKLSTDSLALGNFVIEGVAVNGAVFTQNDSTGAVIKLTLAGGSNTMTGNRNITISGIKSDGGVVGDTKTVTELFVENVKPTVVAATLTATNQITLEFSEGIATATIVGDAADFELWIGGIKSTIGLTESGPVVNSSNKKFTIDLGTALTADDVAKTIIIKKASTFAVTDDNGNGADFTEITLAQ